MHIDIRFVKEIPELAEFYAVNSVFYLYVAGNRPVYATTGDTKIVFCDNWYCDRDELIQFFRHYGHLSRKVATPASFGYSYIVSKTGDIFLRSKITDYRYKFLKSSIYGGRCEVYRYDIGTYYYDINSSYPFELTRIRSRSRYFEYLKGPSLSVLKKDGVSYVTAKVRDVNIPVLPHRVDGRVYYATGNVSGYYTHDELRYAIEQNNIISIKIENSYINVDDESVDFEVPVYELYELRNEHRIFKQVLNSAIGRLSAGGTLYRGTVVSADNCDIKLSERVGLKLTELHVNRGLNPYIVARVLARARIRLHKLIVNYNALYADTDAIITNNRVSTGIGSGIGELKEKVGKYLIAGTKRYVDLQTGKIKFAGLPRRNHSINKLAQSLYSSERLREGQSTKPMKF